MAELVEGVRPAGPPIAPHDPRRSSAQYLRLAVASGVAVAAFFAAYLGAMIWFGWTGVQLIWSAFVLQDDRHVAGGLAGAAALAALALLGSSFVRRRPTPTIAGVPVTAADQPTLFAFVTQLAREVDAPAPDRVVLTADATLRVAIVPDRWRRSSRVLVLGLGLIGGLDRRTLEAAIARELGSLRHLTTRSRRGLAFVDRLLDHHGLRDLAPLFAGLVWLRRAFDRAGAHDADRRAMVLADEAALAALPLRTAALARQLVRAHGFADREAIHGRGVVDLFAVQLRIAARIPAVAGDPDEDSTGATWAVFDRPEAVRAEVTALARARPSWQAALASTPLDATLARLDVALDRPHLAPRYRGLYLEPGLTRLVSVPTTPPSDPRAAVAALYPRELVDELLARDQRRDDRAASQRIAARESRARVVHHRLAEALSPAWAEAVRTRWKLWHWAEHTAAEVREAVATIDAALAPAVARGSALFALEYFAVTQAGTELASRITALRLSEIVLPPEVAARLDGRAWHGAFAPLGPPHHDLGAWLHSMRQVTTRALDALDDLAAAALDDLLATEDRVVELATAIAAGDLAEAPIAPGPARVPERYPQHVRDVAPVVVPPSLRVRVRGPLRTAGRAARAVGLVGGLLVATHFLRKVEVAAYNGTGGPVVVTIDGERRTVAPGDHARFHVDAGRISVSTRTTDGEEIEVFHEWIDERHRYVYDVATALPLLEETVLYAHHQTTEDVPDSRVLPLRRWHAVTIDWLFVTPARTKQVEKGQTKSYTMVSALLLEQEHPAAALGILTSLDDAERVVEAQLRWRPSTARYAAAWWNAGADLGGVAGLLARRMTRTPDDPLLRTVEQDHAGERHAAVCAEHRARAAERPDDPNWQYLAARCLDPEARSAAMDAALQRWPDAPWLLLGAGQAAAAMNDLAKAERLLTMACFSMAHHCDAFAIDIARARRALGSDPFAGLPIGGGPHGYLVKPHADAWWLKLRRGDLALAVSAADTIHAPVDGQRARWLAAASDDAAPSFLADAEASVESGDINDPSLALVIYALRRRAGRAAPTDLDEAVNAAVADSGVDAAHDAAALHGFVTLLTTDSGAHLDTAETALMPIAPVLRGRAYVAAAILLGPRCPPRWRTLATQLLFDHERPWFKPAA